MRKLIKVLFVASLLMACKSTPTRQSPSYQSLIGQMTLDEKLEMIHCRTSFTNGAVPRLNIPALIMSDGPYGVRVEHGEDYVRINAYDDQATYLPKCITLGATWNKDLGLKYGEVLGAEANERGKDVILGPGVNIIRTPLNGRNFEYLSEDPFLTKKMGVGYIKGVQSQGVAACVKHLVANNQETWRNSVDVELSERPLREIYLPAFKEAVQQGNVLTLMGAYNKLRGEFCSHHDYLLNQILKDEWGFKGLVVSDWGAVHNTKEALENGLDLEMGTELYMKKYDYDKVYLADPAKAMIESGQVDEAVVDDKVERILYVMDKIHMLNNNEQRPAGSRNTTEHQLVAKKVAEEGIVLLKNEGLLPIKNAPKKIAVIGRNANQKTSMGGGSSQVNALYEVTALEGIKNIFGEESEITYCQGYDVNKAQKRDEQKMQEAINAAKAADLVIYVGGWIQNWDLKDFAWRDNAFDSEAVDKLNMKLPFHQEELIMGILKANPQTVVVMMGGGPVEMNHWLPQTKALIQAWYPGMEGGNALAEIIAGKVNPSGKLPMTFPKKLVDAPAHHLAHFPGKEEVVKYTEGIFVGYRFFDTFNVAPAFCFGHGLSYTTFEVDQLKIKQEEHQITASVQVTNTGEMAGKEVVQLYVSKQQPALERAEQELKGFEKIALEAGASKTLEITIPLQELKYFDEKANQWVLEPGTYEFRLGTSSRDIHQSAIINLNKIRDVIF